MSILGQPKTHRSFGTKQRNATNRSFENRKRYQMTPDSENRDTRSSSNSQSFQMARKRKAFWNCSCWCLFSFVPDDLIVRNVLSFLPTVDLAQTSAVCKRWNFISRCPTLWRTIDMALLPRGIHRDDLKSLIRQHGQSSSTLKLCDVRPDLFTETLLLEALSCVSNVKQVHFCNVAATNDFILEQFATSCHRLEKLFLNGCSDIEDSGVKNVICATKNLQQLSLLGCKRLTSEILEFLPSSLEILNLSNCTLVTSEPSWCHSFKRTYALKSLNLHGLSVTDEDVQQIVAFCPLIDTFALSSSNPFMGSGISDSSLSYLSLLVHLKDINLMGADRITDNGLVHLLQSCTKIEKLSLGFCSGLSNRSLLRLSDLPRLTHLSIFECTAVSDETMLSLSSLMYLKYIDCHACHQLTRASLPYFIAGFPSLQFVNIMRCGDITSVDVEYLMGRRPLLDVLHA